MANNLQELVTERGIRCLTHFTKLANLPSIMARGLLTRDIIFSEGDPTVWNDAYRHDGTHAICATIDFPNYKMFWPLRCEAPEGTDWIVIALKPSVLWELPCAFCVENAASGRVTAIPLEQRRGVIAMEAMYGDYPGKQRATLGLPPQYTTHPQAEVLILENVPPAYIMTIAVQDEANRLRAVTLAPTAPISPAPQWFGARRDSAHWKKID
ncbi:hypothetical protein PCO31111_05112 [Pandoraea communis]|uniref:DarT domain-containing protein n=1 Tax=Pandoraea communis TaxID=2508297 RepID=A0A5E4Z6J9_9BURK|nr:DarT ssDNA thymidine ADP-ribosyltransferase family protein [Pandoraea communis]VVE56307.1 hypothetical protein PCO31111_05112 [Pandoraea communis]